MQDSYTENKGIPYDKLALYVLLVSITLNGIIPHTLLVYIEAPLIVSLAFTGIGYLAFPIAIFYYYPLGLFMGISVYRLFSIAFILGLLIRSHFQIKNKKSSLIILCVFLVYEILVMSNRSLQIAISSFVDMFAVFLLVTSCLDEEEKVRNFFKVFVIVAFLAIITGLFDKNAVETAWATSDSIVNLSRFQATFEDPNYMGYFYNLAIFSVVVFKPFRKQINVFCVIYFSIVILSTLSMTAIIGNILFWLIYLLMTKRVSVKVFFLIILVSIVAVFLYDYGLNHFETPIIGQLAFRINEKISAFAIRDWGTVTTNRSNLLDGHKELYFSQGIIKQLFGGNVVSTYLVDLPGANSIAHNDYIDTLLNVGLIGGIVLLASCLSQTFTNYRLYRDYKEDMYAFKVLHKCIWFYYLTTLTVFLDFRFMMGLFI